MGEQTGAERYLAERMKNAEYRVEYWKAVLAEMPTEALVEELLVRLAGREVWWCEYPEFNDPNCMTGMTLPAPGAAALPQKHSMCRWVWIVEQQERP